MNFNLELTPETGALRQADDALGLEWLETDGLGGFSSGTLALANTRGYHALYNPAVHPPLGRMVLWSMSQETLFAGNARAALGVFYGRNGLTGTAHRALTRFTARPWPQWSYAVCDRRLDRELFLEHGTGVLHLGYTWHGLEPAELRIRPYLAFRDHHEPADAAGVEPGSARMIDGELHVRFRAPEPLLVIHPAEARFFRATEWRMGVRLPVERYRGLTDQEDLWSPGEFALRLLPGETAWLRAGLAPEPGVPSLETRARELARRNALRLSESTGSPVLDTLPAAADQFLIRRGDKHTVIAGYPWFTDWGRDTMIALPGLTLATGRVELAKELLDTFAGHLKDGLIPNRFPDANEEPEYNTVDATLWLAVAAWQTWQASEDRALVERLYPVLEASRDAHQAGTRHGIRVAEDGLLAAGEPGVQLTWMDAKVDDWVVTPRMGKPVEIQALWFNFLTVGARFAELLGRPATPWNSAAARVPSRFRDLFWSEVRGYLADVIAPDDTVDASLRPNQLLALSLPFPLVQGADALRVLAAVREHLATPRGLRSLDSRHPSYHERYGGNRRERDAAYHQGTVWGWLAGPYYEAWLRFGGPEGERVVAEGLAAWERHLGGEGCVGQGSEIFDAAPPHTSRGCPAQAWTVAELLRLALRVRARNRVASQEPVPAGLDAGKRQGP